MNRRLEVWGLGVCALLFGGFLMVKEGAGVYTVLLVATGAALLLYGIYKKRELSDFSDPEAYDERDELIQNRAAHLVLTVLTYIMLLLLVINSFIEVPLNYALVLLVMLAAVGKQLVIKLVEKFYDHQ